MITIPANAMHVIAYAIESMRASGDDGMFAVSDGDHLYRLQAAGSSLFIQVTESPSPALDVPAQPMTSTERHLADSMGRAEESGERIEPAAGFDAGLVAEGAGDFADVATEAAIEKGIRLIGVAN